MMTTTSEVLQKEYGIKIKTKPLDNLLTVPDRERGGKRYSLEYYSRKLKATT